MNRIKKR